MKKILKNVGLKSYLYVKVAVAKVYRFVTWPLRFAYRATSKVRLLVRRALYLVLSRAAELARPRVNLEAIPGRVLGMFASEMYKRGLVHYSFVIKAEMRSLTEYQEQQLQEFIDSQAWRTPVEEPLSPIVEYSSLPKSELPRRNFVSARPTKLRPTP